MQTHRVIYCNGWFVPQYRRWLRWHNYLVGMGDIGGSWTETVAFESQAEAWEHIRRNP
jgi:hypothetical protein